jgi:hypothetical protein
MAGVAADLSEAETAKCGAMHATRPLYRGDSSLSQNGYFITWPSGQARLSAADVG